MGDRLEKSIIASETKVTYNSEKDEDEERKKEDDDDERCWWVTTYSVWIGWLIRCVLMIGLPWALDDGNVCHGVKYTDIDYHVYTDAAEYMRDGKSPYDRHTYRYTPFLAAILSSGLFYKRGRWLFCMADVLCGNLICQLRCRHSKNNNNKKRKITIVDCLWWLYNPLAINICTRGSAESFIVLLPVLLTVSIAVDTSSESSSSRRRRFDVLIRAFLAGILHGAAIHSKLYPLIYTVSFMASFSFQQQEWHKHSKQQQSTTFPWCHPRRLIHLIRLWIKRLFGTASSVLFLISTLASFGTLTYAAYIMYGPKSLEEGLLYHFSRLDHRHNYSMYWYWIYLYRGKMATTATAIAAVDDDNWWWGGGVSLLSLVSVLPQALLLAFSSLGLAPYDLTFALFVQTFLFVTQNKVMTAQYFTWYLCLLPLCSNRITWNTNRMMGALLALLLSILTWLASAFALEMLGLPVHLYVWAASILCYMANIHLIVTILIHYNKGNNNNNNNNNNSHTHKSKAE